MRKSRLIIPLGYLLGAVVFRSLGEQAVFLAGAAAGALVMLVTE